MKPADHMAEWPAACPDPWPAGVENDTHGGVATRPAQLHDTAVAADRAEDHTTIGQIVQGRSTAATAIHSAPETAEPTYERKG